MTTAYMEIPDIMLSEIAALLDPVWQPILPERLDRMNKINSTTDVPRPLIEMLLKYFEDCIDGGCDHEVNVCTCEYQGAAKEIRLLLQGKITCPQCGGDGFVWDKERYDANVAALMAENGWTRGQVEEVHADEPGYADCPTCAKTHTVTVEQWQEYRKNRVLA